MGTNSPGKWEERDILVLFPSLNMEDRRMNSSVTFHAHLVLAVFVYF